MDALNLFSWVAGSSLCAVGNAARTNRTIDDTYGDSVTGALPTYTPPVDWTAGQNCSDCLVAPRDLSQVLNGTWHDTSQFYTSDTEHRITVTFSGTAVSVYGILANQVEPGLVTATNLSFSINGSTVGTYEYIPTGTGVGAGGYLYNAPVYSNASMPQGTHTLTIGTLAQSVFLFDYIEYTYKDSAAASTSPFASLTSTIIPYSTTSPTSTATPYSASHRVPVGAIAGGVVGGLALLLLLLLSLCFYRHRHNRQKPRHDPMLGIEHKYPSMTAAPSVLPWSGGGGGADASRISFDPYMPPAPKPASFAGAYHDQSESNATNGPAPLPTTTIKSAAPLPTAIIEPIAPSPLAVVSTHERRLPVTPLAAAASPSAKTAAGDTNHGVQSQIDALNNKVERLRVDRQDVNGMAPPAYE